MDEKAKIAIAVVGTAAIAFSFGYIRGTSRVVRELGAATSKEALIYLATQDSIRNRFR
jgi:hypothetical protein